MPVNSQTKEAVIDELFVDESSQLLFNSDGLGYGLFPADIRILNNSANLTELERGSALVNYFENLLQGNNEDVLEYHATLLAPVQGEMPSLNLWRTSRNATPKPGYWMPYPICTTPAKCSNLRAIFSPVWNCWRSSSEREIFSFQRVG